MLCEGSYWDLTKRVKEPRPGLSPDELLKNVLVQAWSKPMDACQGIDVSTPTTCPCNGGMVQIHHLRHTGT